MYSKTRQVCEKFLFQVSVFPRFRGAAMHIFTTEARKDGNPESFTTEQFFRKADLMHYKKLYPTGGSHSVEV